MLQETGIQFPMRDATYEEFYREEFLPHAEEILLTQRQNSPEEIRTANPDLYLFLVKNTAFLALLKDPNFFSATYNLGIDMARRYVDKLAHASQAVVPTLSLKEVTTHTEYLGRAFNPKYIGSRYSHLAQVRTSGKLDTLYRASWDRMKTDEPNLWELLTECGRGEYAFGAPMFIGGAHYYFPIRDSVTRTGSWQEVSEQKL